MPNNKELLDKAKQPRKLDPSQFETMEEYEAAYLEANPGATHMVVGNETYPIRKKQSWGEKVGAFFTKEPEYRAKERWNEAKATHSKQLKDNNKSYFVRPEDIAKYKVDRKRNS